MFKYLRISAPGISQIRDEHAIAIDKYLAFSDLTRCVHAFPQPCAATGILRSLVIRTLIPRKLYWSVTARVELPAAHSGAAYYFKEGVAWQKTLSAKSEA